MNHMNRRINIQHHRRGRVGVHFVPVSDTRLFLHFIIADREGTPASNTRNQPHKTRLKTPPGNLYRIHPPGETPPHPKTPTTPPKTPGQKPKTPPPTKPKPPTHE